ncbi:MAG: MTH1187 family thiamine-binding protein [Aeoliella sp.]
MSIVPMGKGQSVSPFVAKCVDLVDLSGLDYELHSMGTIVEGPLDEVLALMRQCIEVVANDNDRVTCSAKLDYRKGASGRLKSKVASVEQKLGRKLKGS